MSEPPELNSLPLDGGADAVMMSVAELAERDGVSRPAISQKVKRLVEQHGLSVERDDRGRVSRVNVAHYDLLRERVGDPSKDQRPQRDDQQSPTDPDSYDEARRKKTHYEAERERLLFEAQVGELIKVADLEPAIDACAEKIAAVIRGLQGETDALASAVARDGVHGLRVALKALETKMLAEIATALEGIAEGRTTSE